MPDPITRLNAALEGRYAIERELGEGRMATGLATASRGDVLRVYRLAQPECRLGKGL